MQLRLSIRDLLWVTILFALLIGWRLDHLRADRQIVQDDQQITQARAKLDTYVEYFDELQVEAAKIPN